MIKSLTERCRLDFRIGMSGISAPSAPSPCSFPKALIEWTFMGSEGSGLFFDDDEDDKNRGVKLRCCCCVRCCVGC